MKKQLILSSVLFVALSASAQNYKYGTKQSQLINTKILATEKFGSNESAVPLNNNQNQHSGSEGTQSGSKTSVTNNWNNFTGSMNIYGSVIGFCKPLQWNDELNAVSFVHRKSASYQATGTTANTESGAIVTMISADCGGTWDSTLVYSDATNRGRYPQGAIYNPPTNTNINDAYIVTCGPVTLGSGWVGNFYASKQLGQVNYDNVASSVPNAMQYFASAGPYTANLGRHDFSAYGFTATDDGLVRSLAGITDPNLGTAGIDTAVMLVTGTFNNGVFDWAGTVFNPPLTIDGTDGSKNFVSRPMMAWNESGTHGYVVIIGSRIGATGSNVGMQPIVYKTTNSGATWSLENGIDFNNAAFADVKRSIITVASDSTLEVPNFTWIESMDCAVDANNKLHVFTTIYGHASNHPDSLGYYRPFTTEGYKWPHEPGFRPYLYDFIYDGNSNWSHIVVDSMSTEGPAGVSTGNGYQDNPWDMDPSQSNQKVRIDARLQMSRTPDGKYIVYTWAESDTTVTTQQKKWNTLPNVKARLLDVTTGSISAVEINVTGTGNGISAPGANGAVANRAMYHFVSPKCRVAGTTTASPFPAISMPITVSNSNPYAQLGPNSHWFSWSICNFGNVLDCDITACGTLTNSCVSVPENALTSAGASYIFPNPAKNAATLNISLMSNSKIALEVYNNLGQVVKTKHVDGNAGSNSINFELNGLTSGIYLVKVKVDNASSTKKLIIE